MSLFNEVYAAILDFCDITSTDIVNETQGTDWVVQTTISGWRTRVIPSNSFFDILCGAIRNILIGNVQKMEYCKLHKDGLKKQLEPIWNKYSASEVKFNESDDIISNVLNILKESYTFSKLSKVSVGVQ